MTEKIEVNGEDRHPLYQQLVETPNESGETGDVQWNFEKFLVDANGDVAARYRPDTVPDDPAITEKVESLLG